MDVINLEECRAVSERCERIQIETVTFYKGCQECLNEVPANGAWHSQHYCKVWQMFGVTFIVVFPTW